MALQNALGGLALDASLTNGTQKVMDQRGLVERLLAKAPAPGYHLWLDVTSTKTPMSIFIAEAPDGSTAESTTFRGVLVQLENGLPFGAVLTASGFAWSTRATAVWTS